MQKMENKNEKILKGELAIRVSEIVGNKGERLFFRSEFWSAIRVSEIFFGRNFGRQ